MHKELCNGEFSGPSPLLLTIHDNEGLEFLSLKALSIQVLITRHNKHHTHTNTYMESIRPTYCGDNRACKEEGVTEIPVAVFNLWFTSNRVYSILNGFSQVLGGKAKFNINMAAFLKCLLHKCYRFSQLLLLSCEYHSPVLSSTLTLFTPLRPRLGSSQLLVSSVTLCPVYADCSSGC